MRGTACGVLVLLAVSRTIVAAGAVSEERRALGVVFESALSRAMEKLEAPACRLVLSDFRDESGRPLAERLAATSLAAPEFLAQLDFRSGGNEDPCQRSLVDAFTVVGSSRVWICPRGNLGFRRPDADAGSTALIHEMLHALGLHENPPSSLEITRHVVARCGR